MQQAVVERPSAAAGPAVTARPGAQLLLVGGWLVLAGLMAWWPCHDLGKPGLYYDEATYPGQAKDFVHGPSRGAHMPGSLAVPLFGRPFPILAQPYLGGVKAWLTMPAVALFGSTTAVVRASSIAWSAVALLLFIEWSAMLIGPWGALLAGALLALDPSYLWMTAYDWGPVVPGFLARGAGFLLLLHWWRRTRAGAPAWASLFLGAVCLGLGVQHKLDFLVVLAGVGGAVLLVAWRPLRDHLRRRRRDVAIAAAGLLLGIGPMLGQLLVLAPSTASSARGTAYEELIEKGRILGTLYDGSYFARLMDAAGDYRNALEMPATARDGMSVATSAAILGAALLWRRDRGGRPLLVFLVSGLVLQTAGVLVLPHAIRIHHALLAYPFPHVLIAAVVLASCRRATGGRAVTALAAAAIALLLASDLHVLATTERMILRTGGRGWWSDAIEGFAAEVAGRSDLAVVSLDWGFNEQLLFLTDGPALGEMFWLGQQVRPASLRNCAGPDRIYLAHPPALTHIPYASGFLRACQAANPGRLWVRPYRDREGNVAFFAVRFAPAAPPGTR